MNIQAVMEVMVGGGYIRHSDLSELESLLASEGISFKDQVVSNTADMDAKLKQAEAAIAELARMKAQPSVQVDRPVADTRSSNGILSLWHPPGKPEDLRVYVNAKGLRKVHLVSNTDGDVMVRGRFGKPASREEVYRVANILEQLGLKECTWSDVLTYVAAMPVSEAQAGTDLAMLAGEAEVFDIESQQQ